MSEGDLLRAIRDAVNLQGLAHVWRAPSGKVRVRGGFMQLAPAGTPDLVGFMLRDGRFVGIEVKVPKHKTDADRRKLQAEFRERVVKSGGVAFETTNTIDACVVIFIESRRVAA